MDSEGRYYGLPFCCNNVALIYNTDLFSEEGIRVPENWNDILNAATQLTKNDRYGFAMSAVSGEEGAFQFASLMLSAGDTIDQAGEKGTLKAFQLIQSMVEQGVMPYECLNWSQNDVARAFIDGKCGMMINGPWVFPALDNAGMNYGITSIPTEQSYTGLLGGEVLGILKGKNKAGSIAFLEYYNQNEVMLNANLLANSLPPKKDLANKYVSIKPKYEIILSQVEHCVSRTSYDRWSDLSTLLSDGLFDVLMGDKTPEQECRIIKEKLKP